MSKSEEINVTPGMQRYIDKNNDYLAERDRYIREEVKSWKFDTIAVHGLYTVQDAIEDYQGAIIEPIFMSSSQAYRDSDEMAAALAYLIPTWCYSRIANPSTYYYEWTLALLEGYGFDGETGCCSTSSGMAAIMTAVQPFLVHAHPQQARAAELRRHGPVLRRHVPAVQRAADGRARHRVPLGHRRRPTSTSGRRRSTSNTRFLYGELPSNPGLGFFDIKAVADLAHAHNLPLICDSHDRHAGPAAADLPRGRHRGAVGHQDALFQRLRRLRSGNRTEEPDHQHRQRAMKSDFALLRQVPAQPRLRPEPAPHAGRHGPERHADAALEDRPDEPQHDAGGRVPRSSTRRSRACSIWGCPTIRCTTWPAATCGSWTPSTTTSTASR